MLYYSYTQKFSLTLLYCCYSYCMSFLRSLMAFVCQKNKRITYLLTYIFRIFRSSSYNKVIGSRSKQEK